MVLESVLDESGFGMKVVLDESGFGMKVVLDEKFWDEKRHFHPNVDESAPNLFQQLPSILCVFQERCS